MPRFPKKTKKEKEEEEEEITTNQRKGNRKRRRKERKNNKNEGKEDRRKKSRKEEGKERETREERSREGMKEKQIIQWYPISIRSTPRRSSPSPMSRTKEWIESKFKRLIANIKSLALVLRFMAFHDTLLPSKTGKVSLRGQGYTWINSQHSRPESTSLKKCRCMSQSFSLGFKHKPKIPSAGSPKRWALPSHTMRLEWVWFGRLTGYVLHMYGILNDIKTSWHKLRALGNWMELAPGGVELAHISQMGSNTLYLPKDWRMLTHYAGDLPLFVLSIMGNKWIGTSSAFSASLSQPPFLYRCYSMNLS